MGILYGIDLGTTYSEVAYRDENGSLQIVLDAEGNQTIPSVVFFNTESKEEMVGKIAKDQMGAFPQNCVAFVKRHIGELDKEQDPNANPFSFTPPGDKTAYNAAEISGKILYGLARMVDVSGMPPLKRAVITIPAYFGERERRDTMEAAKLAGIEVIQLLDEPVAAAIAYQDHFKNEVLGNVMVYDLGGGTFDLTLMTVSNDKNEIVAKGGDKKLGGKDWDVALLEKVLIPKMEEACRKAGKEPPSKESIMDEAGVIFNTWMQKVESAKRSVCGPTKKSVVNLETPEMGNIPIEVTLEEFDKATEHLLQRTISKTRKTLEEAKEKTGSEFKVDKIILVGGSTFMPQVSARIKQEFGIEPKVFQPNLAVAKGAAVLAASTGELTTLQPPPNILSKSYGIRCVDKDDEYFFYGMMLKQQPTSINEFTHVFNPSRDNMKSLDLSILETDQGLYKENLDLEKQEREFYDMDTVSCIHKANLDLPSNTPRSERVVVRFWFDKNQLLHLDAWFERDKNIRLETQLDGGKRISD